MRKTAGLIFTVAFLAASFIGIGAHCQEDITHVSDSAFSEHMRPPVPFLHDDHNEKAGIDCAFCHHGEEDGQRVETTTSEGQECSECHLADEAGNSKPMNLIMRYHQNCKGCHLEQKAGPVLCGECHKD